MPDQYTCVHPIDHQPSHADRQTAEFLLDAKRRDMTAYEASFAHGLATGRIVEGVAPRQEQTARVAAHGQTFNHVARDANADAPRVHNVAIARRGSEPSVGE